MISTRDIYNADANRWQRTAPVLLSDFTARPAVLARCAPLQGADVLDLGCGEGYVARQIMEKGAASLLGIDISAEMVERARRAEEASPLGISYRVGDATALPDRPDGSVDLAIAVFLFNYLTIQQMHTCMQEVARLLRPGGRFVFSIPHPSLPFVRSQGAPFYFDPGSEDYYSGRDKTFEGEIWRRDGASVRVRCVHKIWSDYFEALQAAGLSRVEVFELSVTEEHLQLDPAFFGPLKGVPLHVAFRVSR